MGKRRRYLIDRLLRLSDTDMASIDLMVAVKVRRQPPRLRAVLLSLVRFWRDWRTDPYMKNAYVLMALALAWWHWLTPRAPTIAGHLWPLLAGVVYVMLLTMPAVFAATALRYGLDSVRYRIAKYMAKV